MPSNEGYIKIDSTAIVQTNRIGDNSTIWQYVVILRGAVIGKNANVCSHCFIEGDVIIGDSVTIKNGVKIYDGARIANNVFIGPNVIFANDKYPVSKNRHFNKLGTRVDEGASLGAGVIVMPGVSIGAGAVIGAGAIVTKDIPAGMVARNRSELIFARNFFESN